MILPQAKRIQMPANTWTDTSLPELRRSIAKVFRRGGGTRPDVLVIEIGGNRAVLKDYGSCDPWFARMLGPLLARREARALTRLEGVEGVPTLLGRPDSRSLLLEYREAVRLEDAANDTDWRDFFERLTQLTADMHALGIAHCDLRSPFNTLIDAAGNPVIVDFVASLARGPAWNVVANGVFERFARADRDALIKLKKSAAPDLVSDEEHERHLARGGLEQFARWTGSRIRSLSKTLFARGTR